MPIELAGMCGLAGGRIHQCLAWVEVDSSASLIGIAQTPVLLFFTLYRRRRRRGGGGRNGLFFLWILLSILWSFRGQK
jgi:hypothetical protein